MLELTVRPTGLGGTPLPPTPKIPPNLSHQLPKEPPRLPNRQEATNKTRAKYPDETNNHPRRKEALAEDIVREEHRHRD